MKRNGEGGLIARRAVERGIEVAFPRDQWVVLRHDGSTHRFRLGRSTLNTQLARKALRQKEVTARLLRHHGILAPENAVFDDPVRAWSWAEHLLPVVVKPNAATKGTLVHVGIDDGDTFEKAFRAVFDRFGAVLVEPMVPGVEHRFAVVNNEVVAVMRRVPMNVSADGVHTVHELVGLKNEERRRRKNPVHKLLKIDDEVERTLAQDGLTLDSVPRAAQIVWLRRTSNISIGGDGVDATDQVAPEHLDTVERASRAIPGLRMAGFDVLIDGAKATVLEINTAPMFSMHHHPWVGQPRDVYSRVLDAMFPQTATAAPPATV